MQKPHIHILSLLLLIVMFAFFGCSDMAGHSFTGINGVVKGTVKDQRIEDFLPDLIEMFHDSVFEGYDLIIRSDKEKKYGFSFEELKTKDDFWFLIESKLKFSVKDLQEYKVLIIDKTNSIRKPAKKATPAINHRPGNIFSHQAYLHAESSFQILPVQQKDSNNLLIPII
jgi:hypothetical protein